MKSANRVFKNTLFLYAKMCISIFSSLYATRLILTALGANDFGIFALVTGLIGMLVFLNSAMTQSSQRFMSFAKGKNDIDEEKSVFNISIVLHVLIAFVIVTFLELLGPLLFDHVLKIDIDRLQTAKVIYQFMILSTVFTILSVPNDAVINANEDMLFVAVLGIIESLLKLGIAFYITYATGDKLIMYGFLIAFLSMLIMSIKFFYSFRKYEEAQFDLKKYFDKKLFKKMYHFASYSLLGISTQMITSYGRSVVLNMFFGTIVNAAEGIVDQVSGQLNVFAFTMLKALNPLITKSEGAGNRKLMLDASFIGIKISFYLLILFYIPVLLEMPTIFKYWLINVPEYTVIFGTALLVKNLIEQLYVNLSTSIISVGNIKHFQIYNALLNLFPLPVAYIFFSLGYPPVAIYLIFIGYALVQGNLYVYFAKKECGMSVTQYFKEVVIKAIVPFVIILLIVSIPHLLIVDDLYRLLVVIIVNFIVFTLVIWNVGLSLIEKEFIIQLITRMRKRFNL